MLAKRILKHFHFCCGLGGGAKGFNRAKPVVGNHTSSTPSDWRAVRNALAMLVRADRQGLKVQHD